MLIATIRRCSSCLLLMTAGLLLLAGCASRGPEVYSSVRPGAAIVLAPGQRSEVVLTAMGLLQSRYRYGGSNPDTGFDCSGLVAYVFGRAAGQSLPHNTARIAELARPVPRSQLKAGDFVFFNTLNRPFSHMGIYIGNAQFVNAPSTGGQVRVDSLNNPYFARRFESARTLFGS